MDDYIDVKIDIFEHTNQRARVRRNLTVADLIDEILREFDDIAADTPEKYAVYLKGFDRPLTPSQTLIQLDIQPQDELTFEHIRQTIRQMLDPKDYAILREETTGKEFDIQWQPAVIGRPSTDVDHNIMLAANVQLMPNGMTVSRKHAQITFTEGRYFIEPLADKNPVFLNGKELPVNARKEIANGDKLVFGRSKLSMIFLSQSRPDVRPATREPVSQPLPSTPAPVPQPVQSQSFEPDATKIDAPVATAALVIEASSTPENVGVRIELLAYPFLLGRTMPVLSVESEVSRRHAEVTHDPNSGKYYITDLQSTNGVTINGQKISPSVPHEVTPGVRIGLGQVVVVRFEV